MLDIASAVCADRGTAVVKSGDVPAPPRIYTTGTVAKLCGVWPATVSRWFDSGALKGFRIPCSTDRRVYEDDLFAFMRERGMRVPADDRVLVYLLSDAAVPGGALAPRDERTFGLVVGSERLRAAVLGDDDGLAAALRAAAFVRSRHPQAKLYFALSPDVSPSAVAEAGFADAVVLARPLVRETVPQLLAVAG